MRFYFRLGQGIGVSMPWWLAGICYVLWAACLVIVAVAWLVYLLLALIFRPMAKSRFAKWFTDLSERIERRYYQ